MARKQRGLLVDLMDAPWWLSFVLLVVMGFGLRFGPYLVVRDMPMLLPIADLWSSVWWTCFIFLIPMSVAIAKRIRKRRMFERTRRIEEIRSLSWKEFEELLGEAYRRSGYHVRENPGKGPDGGVDLVIQRNGRTHLVQAKQWQSYKVGVKVVREMLGLVVSEKADGAIVVTSGEFTAEALSYARANPKVQLIAGDQLLGMIAEIQTKQEGPISHDVYSSTEHPAGVYAPDQITQEDAVIRIPRTCPSCGGELVSRTARKGTRAGENFWGCSNYPVCRHTE